MRVLITGGAGFVGSSLALRLKRALGSVEVVCLDNLYRKGSELNRERLELQGITFIKADVRDVSAFDLPSCDVVIDAAAEPSVLAGTEGDAAYVVDTNLKGTLNLLEAARGWGAAVLFLSTSRVYPVEALRKIALREGAKRLEVDAEQPLPGVGVDGISEAFPLSGPRTLYGATKYASEVMVREYAAQFGMRTLVDRCGVIAGPWQMGRVDQGIVALWVAAHCFGQPLSYIGYGGKQVRDLLHVEDLADLVVKQFATRDTWSGDVYCVGGGPGVSVSLLELTEAVREATGQAFDIPFVDEIRTNDVPLYVSDARRVHDTWAWEPTRSVRDIVVDTAQWVRDNAEILKPVFKR
jgi:CDP-paratose 2-epimerase